MAHESDLRRLRQRNQELRVRIESLLAQNATLLEALKGMEGIAKEMIDDAVGGSVSSEFYTSEQMVSECQAVLKAITQVEEPTPTERRAE